LQYMDDRLPSPFMFWAGDAQCPAKSGFGQVHFV
jgi:hypothetical protein